MKRIISIMIVLTLLLSVILIQASPVSAHNIGCTPGFWKNHTELWVDYSPGQTLEEVFDVPDLYGLDNSTLLEALSFGGGPGATGMAKNLLRQAVAALLNAASFPEDNNGPEYPVDVATVISSTNEALASGDRSTMEELKNLADEANNAGCPIDAHGNWIYVDLE